VRSLVIGSGALRLILAGIVVAVHYFQMIGTRLYTPIDAASVYGFFFLSGYWVHRLWIEKYSRCDRPVQTFFLSRAMRIYPLAGIATLLMLLFVDAEWLSIVSSFLLFAEKFGYALNPPAWSLGIEVQFYAIAPLLFVALRNRAAAIVILGVGALGWLSFALAGPYLFLACFLFLFALGALYAQHPMMKLAERLAPLSLLLVVIVGVVMNLPAINASLPDLSPVVRHIAILIGLAALPYIAATLGRKSNRLDRILGDLAYPVYLLHWPAFLIAKSLNAAYALPIAVVLTGALSYAVYYLVDRPLERVRHQFVERRKTRAEAVIGPEGETAFFGKPSLAAEAR
jgi:peptidoglycan/LPS O-acetylase OafA/YrhL